jgi:hypothetical protein
MGVKISITTVEVEGGYQVLCTCSDGRPDLRGPVETREACETRVERVGGALALSIMRSIAAGDEASLTISRQKVA